MTAPDLNAPILDAATMQMFKDQLLVTFARRLGHNFTIPVSEIDENDRYVFSFELDPIGRSFIFTVERKQ